MRIVLALLFVLAPAALLGGLLRSWTWCHVPDPAIRACRGTVSAVAIRRCVPKRIPPIAELQQPIPPVERAFGNCEERIRREGGEAVLSFFDSTLKVIEAEHGRNSPAYAHALSQIIVALARAGNRFDLIRPYSKRAIDVSRAVYGSFHRETAMALHTHADVLLRLSKDGYAPEAIPLLREAAVIRRRILGPGHEETVAAEGYLVWLLFRKSQHTDDPASRNSVLEEAELWGRRALAAFPEGRHKMGFSKEELQILLGRIAFARGDYAKAVFYFGAAFEQKDYPYNPYLSLAECRVSKDACREYAQALRELDREKEAEQVEKWIERETHKGGS